ncbi:MAG: hypothetical protein A3J24_04115 [Deltaproteobacteria bacterium RIFCSPLOWO2_02_FULL_53_8]|nr:MAG: hypothetical protein A3J24_04115 [Deltaproteobacteria bacterium RIFCSPLOWO2_02_FULL_53_8]
MLATLRINIAPEEIIKAIKSLGKKERTALLEDILAGTSPDYLKGIKEARTDYKAGKIKTHKEVFGE